MIGIKKVKDMDTKESREVEALAYVDGNQEADSTVYFVQEADSTVYFVDLVSEGEVP